MSLRTEGGCEEHEKLQDESEMVVRRDGARGHLIPHLASETTTERARAAPNRNEKGGRGMDRQAKVPRDV